MDSSKLQGIRTNAFIVNKYGQFLLLRRSLTDEFCAGYWELPGGKVEHGEDAKEACQRETEEEAGIDITVLYPLTSYSYMMPEEGIEKHMTQIIYFCTTLDEKVNISPEHSDYLWADFAHVESLSDEQMSPIVKESLASVKSHPIFA